MHTTCENYLQIYPSGSHCRHSGAFLFHTRMMALRSAFARMGAGMPSLLGGTASGAALRAAHEGSGPMGALAHQVRWASNLGPRRVKYRKAQKGRVHFRTGGSIKGTTVTEGEYGLRALEPTRLSATQLTAAETALKRKLKVVRGSQVFMRVFPDIPVCVKGNETRMGKGKGSFEYWACRYVSYVVGDLCADPGSVPVGRVLFEVGGHVEIRPEVAKEGTCSSLLFISLTM